MEHKLFSYFRSPQVQNRLYIFTGISPDGRTERSEIVRGTISVRGQIAEVASDIRSYIKEVHYHMQVQNRICTFTGISPDGRTERSEIVRGTISVRGQTAEEASDIRSYIKEVHYHMQVQNRICTFTGISPDGRTERSEIVRGTISVRGQTAEEASDIRRYIKEVLYHM